MNYIVTHYLDATVEKWPDKVAFIDRAEKITFSELRAKAFSIANEFVKKEIFKQPVLIFMEKSVPMIPCFMGVAYSGNFYSPLDTKMPPERVNKIIDTFNPSIVLTDKKHYEEVKKTIPNVDIWVYEDLISNIDIDHEKIINVSKKVIDTDILYVLFTSGSTGVPKGVIINHKAVIDFIDWIVDCYSFDDNTVFANQAQLYFDLSIQDVYAPMKTGATTVLIPNRLYSFPTRVWKMILDNNVNTLVWIPSMLSNFANLDILKHVEHAPLKTVLFCGEVMPMKQLNYWIDEYPETVFGNLYGPTECTEACTYYTLDRKFFDSDVLPMGKPCENSDAFIVDDNGDIVTEEGKIGELYVRGTCLSMGYYGNEEKTKESFVQNPLNSKYPELVYKTGDLVCYNSYSELVYVSRKDFQIKIRGYRVELGEIEAAATSIETVEYSCCLFNTDSEKLILVYSGNIDKDNLENELVKKLQSYMIPDEYIKLDQMLFNVNGKIDRNRLKTLYI